MAQRRLIEHGHGPARVIGGFATGKTEALRARARRLANEVGRDRVLVVCRSSAAAHRFGAQATTFWSLALAVLARAGRPVRLRSGDGLLLRDRAIAEAERARFDHAIVDDFEQASFATNRLLALLTGPGENVVVAGNPGAAISAPLGGTSRYLERFVASYHAEADIALERR